MYRPVPGRYVMVPSPGEPFQAFVPARDRVFSYRRYVHLLNAELDSGKM